ncbi:MAG TPA: helix-turn-helix domain-containing protein [Chloroflexota bacterium]|nr:helix-turn-helix domain-containing protein [Chloroflexota bacterium]
MADLQETLGAVIRRERRRRRRTMKWLAEKAALSLVYLGEIERGKKYPSAPVLERLAWALDLPVPSLLEAVAADLRQTAQPARVTAIGVRLPAVAEVTTRQSTPNLTALLGRAA